MLLGATIATVLLCCRSDDAATPVVRPPELPLVLGGIAELVQGTAGIGRACVVLEGVDLRFVLGATDVQAPFMKYRTSIRDAMAPVEADFAPVRSLDHISMSEKLDPIATKHRARVQAAVDAAQAELMSTIGADTAARQRMIRHAVWRSLRDDSDPIGYDVGMLFEDDAEPTSMKLRAALEAHPDAVTQVRALLAAHDARVGPPREASIMIQRSELYPGRVGIPDHSPRFARCLDGVRESNDALFDGILMVAKGCGEGTRAFEWRARAFKMRGAGLLPISDLLDTFDEDRTEGDALDDLAMREARQRALEERDTAMANLVSSYMRCTQTLNRDGPDSKDAERVLRRFTECVERWEKCEKRIGAELKAQLRDPGCRAGLGIDGYLAGQESRAWGYWRDRLQFWTSFVEDQRTPK